MRIARMCAPAPGGPAAFAPVMQGVLLIQNAGYGWARIRDRALRQLFLLARAGGAVQVLIDRWFGRVGISAVAT